MDPQTIYDLNQQEARRHSCAPFQLSAWELRAITALSQQNSTHGSVAMAQSRMASQNSCHNYGQPQHWGQLSAGQRENDLLGITPVNQSFGNHSQTTWNGVTGALSSFDRRLGASDLDQYISGPFDIADCPSNRMSYHNANQNTNNQSFAVPGSSAWSNQEFNTLPARVNNATYSTPTHSSTPSEDFLYSEYDDYSTPGTIPTPDPALPSGNWSMLTSNTGLSSSLSSNTSMLSSFPSTTGMPSPFPTNTGLLPSLSSNTGLPSSLPSNIGPSSSKDDRFMTAAAGLAALARVKDKAPIPGSSFSSSQGITQASFNQRTTTAQAASHQTGVLVQAPSANTAVQSSAAPSGIVQAPAFSTGQGPTPAQRAHNDHMLLQCKNRGESYKMIMGKMIGETPAESTLRGRYRAMTKAKLDRVRKPVWTRVDTDLLMRFVQQELARVRDNVPNADTMTIHQKLARVSWKTVAESIKTNGGSYHFGVTTCKRKWMEMNLPENQR